MTPFHHSQMPPEVEALIRNYPAWADSILDLEKRVGSGVRFEERTVLNNKPCFLNCSNSNDKTFIINVEGTGTGAIFDPLFITFQNIFAGGLYTLIFRFKTYAFLYFENRCQYIDGKMIEGSTETANIPSILIQFKEVNGILIIIK